MPVDFLPRDVLPGHLQGQALSFGTLPLTHDSTFQDTGPTSAYPGHYPRPWLLRASSSHMACGWHLLCKITGFPEGHAGLLRSQFPLFAALGRCSPPGLLAVHTGQYRRVPAPYPLPFWLQRLSLLRWFAFTVARPHLRLRCPWMPARRDTRVEAPRLRRLAPLQTLENQSQAWGLRFHSCTWREGLVPSWKAELRG
jgi:hypothetical protein